MNVVGYKDVPPALDGSSAAEFYMNVVGYKALTLARPKALERRFI